jgi:hypothetical protein
MSLIVDLGRPGDGLGVIQPAWARDDGRQTGTAEPPCSLFGSDTGQGPQTGPLLTAGDRCSPLLGHGGGTDGKGRTRLKPRLWRQLDCRATGMLREHLPRGQPAEASPRPAWCEDAVQGLDPARLVGNYVFCMIYPLFRRR